LKTFTNDSLFFAQEAIKNMFSNLVAKEQLPGLNILFQIYKSIASSVWPFSQALYASQA